MLVKYGTAALAAILLSGVANAQTSSTTLNLEAKQSSQESEEFMSYEASSHAKIVATAEKHRLNISSYVQKRAEVLANREKALDAGDQLEALKQEAILATVNRQALKALSQALGTDNAD
jgi:hypothetical protein